MLYRRFPSRSRRERQQADLNGTLITSRFSRLTATGRMAVKRLAVTPERNRRVKRDYRLRRSLDPARLFNMIPAR